MKAISLTFFGRANIPLALVFVILTFWSQGVWADVSASVSQSPVNNVTPGEKVTYHLQLENIGANAPLPVPKITVTHAQGALPGDFQMDSGGCSRDNNSFSNCDVIGSVGTISFSFTPEKAGKYSFNFDVECTVDNASCSGDNSNPVDTIVEEPKQQVSGNIVFNPTSYKVNEDVGTATLTLKREKGTDGELIATVNTSTGGKATAGEDYDALTDLKVVFANGEESKNISIVIHQNDTGDEAEETIKVSVTDSNGGKDSTGLTIVDVPKAAPGTLQFSASNYPVNEADGQVNITVNRVGGSSGVLSAAFNVADGANSFPAKAGSDYTVPPENGTTLTWADKEDTPKIISIPISSNDGAEPDPETFTVRLGGGYLPGENATVTITDSTPAPVGSAEFSAGDYSIEEGKEAVITVNRTGDIGAALAASVRISGGTASTADYDTPAATQLTLDWAANNQDAKEIRIPIKPDSEADPGETIELELLDANGGVIGNTKVSITDITEPTPVGSAAFSAGDYPIEEGKEAVITVNRTGDIGAALAASVRISGGTASSTDYDAPAAAQLTLDWAANNQDAKEIRIPIKPDSEADPGETIELELLDANGGVIGNTKVSITDITEPTPVGSAAFSAGDYPIEEGKEAVITVNRTGDIGAALAASVRISGGTASTADYDTPAAAQLTLDWAANNQDAKEIRIPIKPDSEADPGETIELELLDANGGVIGNTKVSITDITEPTPVGSAAFSAGDYPIEEGKEAVITVNRTGDIGAALAASVRISGGDAASGSDYDAPSAEQLKLDWAAGNQDPKEIRIPITADSDVDPGETIQLELLDVNGIVISTTKVTITDATEPTVGSAAFSSADYSIEEGKEAVITVNRTGDIGAALAASVRISGGDAASGSDYDAPSAEQLKLDWAAGNQDPKEIRIPITADSDVDPGETIQLELLDVNGIVISTTKVTITDATEPAVGSAQFSTTEYEYREGSMATVTINRSGDTAGALAANIEISDGTGAKVGQDYHLPPAEQLSLVWKEGEDTPRTLEIPIQADEDEDPGETINLNLVSNGVAISTAKIKIIDLTDKGSAKFSSSGFDGKEGENAKVTINREGSITEALTVNVEVSDGTGAKAGTDYDQPSAANLTLSWKAGEDAPRSIDIPIREDADQDPGETINLKLFQNGAAIDKATVNIVDTSQVSIAKFADSNFKVSEEVGIAKIAINREGGTHGPLSARVEVSNGTATSPDDYDLPAELTVSWADGETGARIIQIPIRKDDIPEPDESINLKLFDASGAEIGTAVVTISETASVGTVRFSSESFEFTEGNEAQVKVVRENGSDGDLFVTVGVGLASDSATSGDDYQPPADTRISWGNGDSGERILRIPLKTDSTVEENEIISLQLFEGGGQTLIGSATIIIKDETQPGTVRFSQKTFEAEEGTSAKISVIREEGSDGELTVNLVVGAEGDTASSSEDYAPASDTVLTWGPKESGAKTISIPLLLDNLEESGEFISLQLRQGEQILGDATLNINDVGVLGDAAASVSEVNIVGGTPQTGKPGAELNPFIVKVLNANGEPVDGVGVTWTINPATGGSLSEDANTKTDIDGKSSNTFTVNTADRVVITATILKGSISSKGRQLRAEGDPSAEFIVNGGIADTKGLSTNQKSVAVALDSACPALKAKGTKLTAGEEDLLNTCKSLLPSEEDGSFPDSDGIAEILSLLAPDEITSQGTAVIEAANLQVMNINARLNALRSGAKGLDLSGLSFNIDGQTLPGSVINALIKGQAKGGAAGDDQDLSGKLGVFINGNYSFGDKDDTENETGFEFDSYGITVGADYRLSNQVIFGGAVGVTHNESDFNSNSGSMELDGVHLMAYGTYYQSETFYLDGLIKLGSNDYDTRRRVSLKADPLQEAAGDTKGQEYSLSLSGGYEYNQGPLSYGPYGRLSYTRADIDAYSEVASNPDPEVRGAGSVLSLSDQDVDSATAVLGGQVSYAISRPSGVFMPQARFEWEHEFSDGSRQLAAQFVHDPSNSTFSITTDEPDRDYLNLGLGFSVVTAEGRSGFLYYETRLDQDNIAQNWIKAGVRLEFR